MDTATLSARALSTIDQYLHFKVGNAVCSVPYFNNRTTRARAALRATIGKGSPKDIFDEVQTLLIRAHTTADSLTAESLKKLLVNGNLGVDCSAFAYYILDAESKEAGKGSLDKNIAFINCHGLLGKLRAAMRPVENCSVATLADDTNSSTIPVADARPGDLISMQGDTGENERDHVLLIHQIEYQGSVPMALHYSHAAAYPEDGVYGDGIKQGTIEIVKPTGTIEKQRWDENGKEGIDNRIFMRAQRSKTELRRLK